MEFTVKGKEKKLNFGVRFAAELDESEKYKVEGIEFGMGLMLAEQKLGMGSLGSLATIIKCALHRENVTLDEVYDELDVLAEKDVLDVLFEKIGNELKNSVAVRAARTQMEKNSKEANRKQGVQAVKPTTK